MGKARNTSILASAVDSQGVLSASKGGTGTTTGGSGGPKITSIVVTDSSYTNLDDTAVDLAGGYIKVLGSGFASGCQVLVGSVTATSVTFVSATEVRAQLPATSAGTYVVYLVNSDGGTAIRVNGVSYSATPTWTTGSSLAGASNQALSIQLAATGATTFALASGSSLPSGVSLSSSGLISGTVTGISSDTTYNFTVVATDTELQDSPRTFAFNISAGDPNWKYVAVLLAGNGANNATNNTFLDSGPSNLAITRNGNPTQGTFSPYGPNWSNYFDGTGDYLSLTGTALGSGNFTIELWGYFTSFPGAQNAIYAHGAADGINSCVLYITSAGAVSLYNYTSAVGNSTTNVPLNTWTHIAVTRVGSTLTYYINGVASGTGTTSANISETAVKVMQGFGGITNSPIGYVSNLRTVVGGTLSGVVYTSNFTPPTSPLTAISGTTLLTCQSNRFIDNSTNAFAITKFGDASVQRFSPFGAGSPYSTSTIGGSAYFDGTGDFLTVADNAAVNLSAGDFTIEGWFYALENTDTIINKDGLYAVAYPQYDVALNASNKLQVQFGAGNQASTPCSTYTGTTTVSFNSWNHFAAVRTGSTIKIFLNGNQEVSTPQVQPIVAGPRTLDIAIQRSQFPTHWNGYLAEFRIIKGTALYTASFTPPTTPLTAIANTSFLFSGANAGIIDSTMQNNIETVGDAKISTTLSKFGGSSIYFDGTGDSLSAQGSTTYALRTGDFTVETWFYLTSAGNVYPVIVSSYDGTNGPIIRFGNTGFGQKLQVMINPSTTATVWSCSLTQAEALNTWYHVALVRQSGVCKLYLNGTLQNIGNGANPTTYPYTSFDATASIGTSALLVADGFTGYIDDLRITRGLARYTANFTPPATALPLQ